MGTVDENWTAVADAVRERRKALRLSQAGLGKAANSSRSTVQKVERNEGFEVSHRMLADIGHALGWGAGSIEAILRGGEPAPAEDPQRDETNGRFARVPMDDANDVVRDLVRGVLIAVAPETSISRAEEAEEIALRVLREHGLLPTPSGGDDGQSE